MLRRLRLFNAVICVCLACSGADLSQYWVEHDVSHALADPTGWYVAPVPSTQRNGTMGGAYDPVRQIFYPASPSMPLTVVSGL